MTSFPYKQGVASSLQNRAVPTIHWLKRQCCHYYVLAHQTRVNPTRPRSGVAREMDESVSFVFTSKMADPFASPPNLDPALSMAIDEIRSDMRDEYLQAHSYPWIIGFSGGKDSTLVAHLAFDMLLGLPPSTLWEALAAPLEPACGMSWAWRTPSPNGRAARAGVAVLSATLRARACWSPHSAFSPCTTG